MVLSLVFGLVLFGLGCLAGAGFGATLLVVGMIGVFERIWMEEGLEETSILFEC